MAAESAGRYGIIAGATIPELIGGGDALYPQFL